MSGLRKYTWFCKARCGWQRTTTEDRIIDVCPSCGEPAQWLPGEQPPAPPPTALSYLRRGLADVLGEEHARYAPALLTWLTQACVAVVPHELRDDCPLWGVRGVLTRELGRGLTGNAQLQAAFQAVVAARHHNEGEAQLAAVSEGQWLAARQKRAG